MGLQTLHDEVERETVRLHVLHGDRLECRRGCSSCCTDDLTIWDVEAEPIRRQHAELLATGEPHAAGGCAFLDAEGGCRIYAERPYVCRTQGLPLRWIEEEDGHDVELRDICPLNMVGDDLRELGVEDCWTLGPVEARIARLEIDAHRLLATDVPSQRIPLRALFEKT